MNKILHNAMSFLLCHYKCLPNILWRASAISLSPWKFFPNVQWVDDLLKEKSKSNPHIHTRSSFATWTVILVERCLFSSKSPPSHHPPPAKNQPSLLNTLCSQPSFSYLFFPLILGELCLPVQSAPWDPLSPHLPFSITSSAGNSALPGDTPAPQPQLPPHELSDSSQLFPSHLKSFPWVLSCRQLSMQNVLGHFVLSVLLALTVHVNQLH